MAGLASCVCSAALLTALSAHTALLPYVFIGFGGLFFWGSRGLEVLSHRQQRLSGAEWALLGYALLIGLLRLIPYTDQYLMHHLVGAVVWADHWHFQELASLVNSTRFPPRVNFRPESYLHFYYIAWIPAAALAIAVKALGGGLALKFAYGLDALLLNLATVLVLILFLRHALEEKARKLALLGLLLAGAVCDGIFAVVNVVQTGAMDHSEWWQLRYLIKNQYPSLTSSLELVPHHLISAAGVLLAVATATEPRSFAPRRSWRAFIAAGALVAFSLFASAFVFIGASVALLPILWRLARQPWKLLTAALVVAVIAAPLAYLYLQPSAAGGLVIGQPWSAWQGHFGGVLGGLAGTLAATIFMLAAVGWLFVFSAPDTKELARTPLDQLALAAMAYLVSTLFVSFAGWNNYAMRGSVVPILILCCYWGQACVRRNALALAMVSRVKSGPALVRGLFVVMAIAALLGHLNELVLLTKESAESFAYQGESSSCKERIERFNDVGGDPARVAGAVDCHDELSVYHIERNFRKPILSDTDLELLGRGPS